MLPSSSSPDQSPREGAPALQIEFSSTTVAPKWRSSLVAALCAVYRTRAFPTVDLRRVPPRRPSRVTFLRLSNSAAVSALPLTAGFCGLRWADAPLTPDREPASAGSVIPGALSRPGSPPAPPALFPLRPVSPCRVPL